MPRLAAGTGAGLIRARNEDSAYAGRWLCAVADGMGGHAAGDVASEVAVRALQRFDRAVTSPEQLTAALCAAVREVSSELAGAISADRRLSGMGTTLTALLWSRTCVAVAHIGDSRAYLMRRGVLWPITEDHVLRGLIAPAPHPPLGAMLVRYLDGQPGRSPDLAVRETLPGDRFLICSDGLTCVAGSGAIRDALAGRPQAEDAVAELIGLATAAGRPDDVTVIVADVPKGGWTKAQGQPVVLGSAATPAQSAAPSAGQGQAADSSR